jgi:transposase InsO family protein
VVVVEDLLEGEARVQFTSWAFSQNVRDAGLAPSMVAVGSPSTRWSSPSGAACRSSCHGWKTRIELATAIHDYIGLFHNTRRRHSSLGMLPVRDSVVVCRCATHRISP